MGIGDWGLGIGDWGLGRIPNPQSPIPNPQSPIPILKVQKINKILIIYIFNSKIYIKLIKIINFFRFISNGLIYIYE